MGVSEEVAEEIEALAAIFGVDNLEHLGDAAVKLRLVLAPDEDGHVYSSATLEITFPVEYPAGSPPELRIVSGDLSDAAIAEVEELARQTAMEGLGDVVVFNVAEAVRGWLQEHTRIAPPPPVIAVEIAGETSGGPVEDDLDVDSEDLDEEMIEALQELLLRDVDKLRELRRIKKLEGPELRTALRGMLRALTPAQREELVGSSSDSSEDDQANARPTRGAAPKQAPAHVVKLGPAAIECPVGHELTAYSSRPPDYRKFDDGDYTCDVCGRDGKYKNGVYHCVRCFAQGGKQFDACPLCGSRAKASGGGKKTNNNRRKR